MIEFNATFIVAMLSFVLFIMIMNAIFYKPVLNIMRKREEYINSNYQEAKEFSQRAEEFNTQRNEKIKETQAKCRIDIKNIVEAAQTDANSKTSEAREDAKAKIQAKKDALNVEEQNLKNTVKSTLVNDLASSITSKLLGQEVKPQSVNYEIVNKVMD